ncbi:MinD/ParA family protein [Desulfamplus magnetovallimortis]|uniref:MinD/ParA family protein n=1 Tax=Desulfamplus magnetovallimortis TaxID=1246637 RepID=UPI0009BADBFA|nr:MinD/ParA family protein [Desulfamplus magnetovallimortis]
MDQASGLRNIVKNGSVARRNLSSSVPRRLDGKPHKTPPRVIAVTSGKGGVGKTNMVGNLAIALTSLGKRVVIVDTDVGLANIDIIFNMRPKYNIRHIIEGEKTLEEVLVTTSHGVKILPGGSGFSHLTQLTDGEKLNLLTEFEALENVADIVLLDTGAGISSNVLYFNSAADECIVIATREPTSITDSYALMKVMAREYGTRYFKLLVNVVSSQKEAKSVYASLDGAIGRFLKNIVLEYLGYVPHDNMLQKAVLNRSPVCDYAPESPSASAITGIARKLVDSPARISNDGNLKFFMKRLLDTIN